MHFPNRNLLLLSEIPRYGRVQVSSILDCDETLTIYWRNDFQSTNGVEGDKPAENGERITILFDTKSWTRAEVALATERK